MEKIHIMNDGINVVMDIFACKKNKLLFSELKSIHSESTLYNKAT